MGLSKITSKRRQIVTAGITTADLPRLNATGDLPGDYKEHKQPSTGGNVNLPAQFNSWSNLNTPSRTEQISLFF